MALKATIYKAELQITDLDRHYYATHNLTLAQHPSETEMRMMIRLLAFALNADPRLTFTKGLCAEDEPELWRKGYSGEIEQWIELGLPDEKRLRKAHGRAQQVLLYAYGGNALPIWWQNNRAAYSQLAKLSVYALPEPECQALADMAERTMQLQATIEDGEIWLSSALGSVTLRPQLLGAYDSIDS